MAFSPSQAADWRHDIYRALSSSRVLDITTAASRAYHRVPALAADHETLAAAREMLQSLLRQDIVVRSSPSTRLASVDTDELMSSVTLDDPNALQTIERLVASITAHLDGHDDPSTIEAMRQLRDVFANVARFAHQNDVRRYSSTSTNAWPLLTSLHS